MGDTRPVSDECPYCGSAMRITEMACQHCHVNVRHDFPMSRLGKLPVEHQRFVEMFILSGGNLKELAQEVGVSYPTIRSRLDRVIEVLRTEIGKTHKLKGSALDAVEGTAGAARVIKEI